MSEGGFAAGKVASAALLDVKEANDKNGKPYYKYEVFTRTGKQTCFHNNCSGECKGNSADVMLSWVVLRF